jgi:hypothetical protein
MRVGAWLSAGGCSWSPMLDMNKVQGMRFSSYVAFLLTHVPRAHTITLHVLITWWHPLPHAKCLQNERCKHTMCVDYFLTLYAHVSSPWSSPCFAAGFGGGGFGASTGGSLFGASSTPSAFGATPAASNPFGATPSTGLFGAAASAPAASGAGGLFGSSTTTPGGAFGGFGAGGFGAAKPAATPAPSFGGFGASSSAFSFGGASTPATGKTGVGRGGGWGTAGTGVFQLFGAVCVCVLKLMQG